MPDTWTRPDYDTLRANTSFSWAVYANYLALQDITNTSYHDCALDPDLAIKMFREGRPLIRDLYGPDVNPPPIHTPAISYGHPNGLGSELIFPEEGEVAHTHCYKDLPLSEAITALERPVDYAKAGMAPFYIEFYEILKKAFPDTNVGFSYGLEGPLTTAYELRGDQFFLDPFDEPENTVTFLDRLTDSILAFHRFRCEITGAAPFNTSVAGMCDDMASVIPPHMFDTFVIPFWDKYYRGLTSGQRSAHVENLRPAQLKYLETIGLSGFDPSISPQINPKIIAAECHVPFQWRLGGFHFRYMSCQDVRDFVLQAAADGAYRVWTSVSYNMKDAATVEKVHVFIETGKEVEALLAEGKTLADIAARVSDTGREKFWDHWPE